MSPLRPTPPASHQPLPRTLVALVGGIALIEVVLSLADWGIIADPTLRSRVFIAGAFWAQLLHGDAPIFAAQPVTMFVTHALLHGSLLHMVMNMAILLALGRFAADRYGGGVVLPVFLLSAIAGGAAFGLLATGAYPMVGASGAVFGFLGLWIAWDWRRHRRARRLAGAGGAAGGGARRPQRRCCSSGCRGCSPGRRTSAASSPGSPSASGSRGGWSGWIARRGRGGRGARRGTGRGTARSPRFRFPRKAAFR